MANDITKYVTIDNIVSLLKKLKTSNFFVADENYVGGFKTGFVETGTRRQVQIDESQRAYVELWPDPEQKGGNVGESNRPVYFEDAVPKAIVIPSDIGSQDKPIVVVDVQSHKLYKNSDITANFAAGTLTVPGGLKGPLANKDGLLNVGSGAANDAEAQAVYVKDGVLVPIQKTIGSATKPIYMKDGKFTACNDIVYASNIEDKTLKMPNAVGGIKADTTVQTLNGKTFSELFDDLLFPTIYPVVPTTDSIKVSIAFNNYSAQQVAGATAPTASNFTLTYTPNIVTLNGVKQANYSGAKDTTKSYIYINNNTNNKTLPSTVPLGDTTYYWHCEYQTGTHTPVTNKGTKKDEAGNPYVVCPAGSKNSGSVTVNGSKKYYYIKSDGTWGEKLNKCTVSSNKATIEIAADISIPSTSKLAELAAGGKNTNKYIFKIPGTFSELYERDMFVTKASLMEVLVAEAGTGADAGLTCYKYKSDLQKGEIKTHSGKITFNI